MKITYSEGATPLDPDEKQALIPRLNLQSELNEFEQTNIQSALEWASKSTKLKRELVSVDGIKLLHRKMFDLTWRWAGEFRKSDKNLGVAWHRVPEEVKKLCDDICYWDEHGTHSVVETAIRFHHRLVSIHPFPNGTGRISRMVADLYLEYRKQAALTWGVNENFVDDSVDRKEYLTALREADNGKYERLIRFATSG